MRRHIHEVIDDPQTNCNDPRTDYDDMDGTFIINESIIYCSCFITGYLQRLGGRNT